MEWLLNYFRGKERKLLQMSSYLKQETRTQRHTHRENAIGNVKAEVRVTILQAEERQEQPTHSKRYREAWAGFSLAVSAGTILLDLEPKLPASKMGRKKKSVV